MLSEEKDGKAKVQPQVNITEFWVSISKHNIFVEMYLTGTSSKCKIMWTLFKCLGIVSDNICVQAIHDENPK